MGETIHIPVTTQSNLIKKQEIGSELKIVRFITILILIAISFS